MGTPWSEILTDSAMVLVDDIEWATELRQNPAQFFRAKSLYMQLAIPRFNRPPEAEAWLASTPPSYDDFMYTADAGKEAPFTVETGKTGFDLCNATLRTTDDDGRMEIVPLQDVVYDAETGDVTINVGIAGGVQIDLDFYKDGEFALTLNGEMKRLLGICVQTVWESRFGGEFLSRVMKVSDKTFMPPNESTWTREQQAKAKEVNRQLDDELARFEQNLAYRQLAGGGLNMRPPAGV